MLLRARKAVLGMFCKALMPFPELRLTVTFCGWLVMLEGIPKQLRFETYPIFFGLTVITGIEQSKLMGILGVTVTSGWGHESRKAYRISTSSKGLDNFIGHRSIAKMSTKGLRIVFVDRPF